ncbi:lipopolysaccharide heptosyltransferase II [Hippea maritima]|uniref:lipopolysaccharide heptosyltransferase II n=1 Tax=Hippea maritima (strain ATCC 700847 / DSM 10411 / MH2) TaxID=760142 RepID=F2LVG8_HIPMA|nr:lipopolysaccharide heptosyltransferase II [Hippea maritima]AEA33752.1 lipopolysaccharide heptosyltransferase II [Hippea maritima DSM 10411]
MSKRYLIVQTAFLGDAILTEPMIETIKINKPDSFIGIIVIPQNTEVFTLNPKIDLIIPYDKHGKDNGIIGFKKIVNSIKDYRFDYLISPHMSFRSSLLAFFSRIPKRIGFKEADASFLYTHRVKKPKGLHEIDKNLRLLEPLGFKKLIRDIRLYWGEENKKFIEGIFEAYSISSEDKVVVVNPSSVWPTKRWPKEYYKELVKMLADEGLRVVLIGTQKDIQISDFVKNSDSRIVDLTGKTRIKDLFYLIAWSNLLISNDSAPIHIASAFNTPTIDIYGPTVPEFGFYPLSERSKVIQIIDLPCRPCGKHGSISCAEKHFKCMIEIKPEEVFKAALELL